MAQVNYSNIYSEARNRVVALIDDTSNVADPLRASAAETRKWIYSREPDLKSSDFGGFPYIIVHGSDVIPEPGGSVNGKSKFINWELEIEVVSSDRGYGDKDGQGLTNMESISDDMFETFNNITNRQSLRGNSLNFANLESTNVISEDVHNERRYRRSFILSFRSRIQVSA